jgi:hypothetical protein
MLGGGDHDDLVTGALQMGADTHHRHDVSRQRAGRDGDSTQVNIPSVVSVQI